MNSTEEKSDVRRIL